MDAHTQLVEQLAAQMVTPYGVLENDLEYSGYHAGYGTERKWDKVREAVATIKVVSVDQKKGWSRYSVAGKKEANRAQTAANTHAKKIGCKQEGWHLQTSVAQDDTCAFLWMRKVWDKK